MTEVRTTLTPEEDADYDEAMDRVMEKIIHGLHCELRLERPAMVNALLAAAARLAVGYPELAENFRSISAFAVTEFIKRGDLARPN